jgi:hypothetical protein
MITNTTLLWRVCLRWLVHTHPKVVLYTGTVTGLTKNDTLWVSRHYMLILLATTIYLKDLAKQLKELIQCSSSAGTCNRVYLSPWPPVVAGVERSITTTEASPSRQTNEQSRHRADVYLDIQSNPAVLPGDWIL